MRRGARTLTCVDMIYVPVAACDTVYGDAVENSVGKAIQAGRELMQAIPCDFAAISVSPCVLQTADFNGALCNRVMITTVVEVLELSQ